MTNTELTLDQVTAISGGAVAGPNGEGCTDRFIWRDMKVIFGGGKSIVHPQFRVGGIAGQMISPISGGDGCPFCVKDKQRTTSRSATSGDF